MKKIFWCLLLLLAMGCRVQSASYHPPQKKLIDAGWGYRTTAYYARYVKEIEKTPYSGIVLEVIGEDDKNKPVKFSADTFSSRPWNREWFSKNLKELKSVHSEKLTDNFLRVGVNAGSDFDWFDDNQWNQVIEHWKIIAWFAKEAGLRGIAFDPEMYEGQVFNVKVSPRREQYSFVEHQKKVRQRGGELIATISAIYPDMIFFTFWMNEITRPVQNRHFVSRARQQSELEFSVDYNLYPAFINGWLDTSPPTMTFVEGCETAYGFDTPVDFLEAAHWIRTEGLYLVAPENRRKYRLQVQVGFGLYLDSYSTFYKPGERWAQDPLNGSLLERLRSNLESALQTTDEYVWLWAERNRWWGEDIAHTHWDSVLPGMTEVIANSVLPDAKERENQKRFTTLIHREELTNLIVNGNFSETVLQDNHQNAAHMDWPVAGVPAGWILWQETSQENRGKFALLVGMNGRQGENTVEIRNVRLGVVMQSISVKPGKKYFVRAMVRHVGNGTPILRINWKNSKNEWTQYEQNIDVTVPHRRSYESFTALSAIISVPPEASQMVIMTGAYDQNSQDDRVWIKSVEAYQIQSDKWPRYYRTGVNFGVTYTNLIN